MTVKPRILLVNDDGADAPGLWVLFEHLEAFARPVVVAPMREQSGRSHAVTIRKRMALSRIERNGAAAGYELDGMPADCVKLALSRLYRGQIDLVISGINAGSNAGCNILYSGTVAAALEAAVYGLPAIAVSVRDENGKQPTQFETAARIASDLAWDVLENGLPNGVVLNVNVPDLPISQIEGTVLTRQGREFYIDLFESDGAVDGATWCMNVGSDRLSSKTGDHPYDDLVLAERRVSITPLHFDLTSDSALESLRDRIAGLTPAKRPPTPEKG